MTSINNENKRKIQQKYQKYKANQLASFDQTNVLNLSDQNISRSPKEIFAKPSIQLKKNIRDEQYELILKNIQKSDLMFQSMLTDPKIYELSEYLRKQAQQKSILALKMAFPQRYKSLLQTEAKFYKVQSLMKQQNQKHSIEVQVLMQKLLKAEKDIKKHEQEAGNRNQMAKISEDNKFIQISSQLKKKQMQILDLKGELENLSKKFNKSKQDHKNANQVIIQLRELQEQSQKQTQRLVGKLKQAEQKLTKAHKKILEHENQKKMQISANKNEFQQKIQQLKEDKKHLQQLLEQANIRNQYKQSLLKMSEEQNERNIEKLQAQCAQKHDQIQKLREQHLEALRSIDELQERVDMQQDEIVRHAQTSDLQKQQLKNQLQKLHQNNAQMKAQLDAKSELVGALQKSLQSYKKRLQNDLLVKNSQWQEFCKKLEQQKLEIQGVSQQISKQKKKLDEKMRELLKQLKQKDEIINKQMVKIKQAEATLKKYFQRIVQQQKMCCQMRLKIEGWLDMNTDQIQSSKQISQYSKDPQQPVSNSKIKQYEKLIEKLRTQVILLMNASKETARNQNKIVHDLIQENKRLKHEINYSNFATKIQLFRVNQ